MRQDYTLYKRGKIWYGMMPESENSDRRIRFSTGKTNKAEAVLFCQRKVESYKGRAGTFAERSRDWWTERCPYVKESKRNGGEIGKFYMDNARRVLELHILPVLGSYQISEITTGMIEDWKYSLVEEKNLSNKTANLYLSVLRIMFDYWWRRGEIKDNPCVRVRWMRKNSAERGILTPEEAMKVLTNPKYWSNPTAYLANLLSACTGLRAGEVQALRARDFTEDSIIVSHSWVERYGYLKSTKTNTIREVPIVPILRSVLLIGKSPNDFIFTSPGKDIPMYRSCMLTNLRRALKNAGISYEEQKDRKICFHSWRHYLNSRMRVEGFPDVVTQKITGHKTQAMTEHYSHVTAEDAIGVLALQSSFIPRQTENVVHAKSYEVL